MLQEQLNDVLRQVRELGKRRCARPIAEMEKDVLLFAIGHLFDDLEEKYANSTAVLDAF